MLSRKYFRDFSEGATVIEVIEALMKLPPNAKFTCLGDPRFYIHGEEDGSEVWIDDSPMDDLYNDTNMEELTRLNGVEYDDVERYHPFPNIYDKVIGLNAYMNKKEED